MISPPLKTNLDIWLAGKIGGSSLANQIELIGYACGIGAGVHECSEGPTVLQSSPYLKELGKALNWNTILTPSHTSEGLKALEDVVAINTKLAKTTAQLVAQEKFFITVGGDHTCAIGTWSGVATALKPLSLGLVWIDAHLDSHTDQTTPSGNIHGMPLAALLGQGNKALTDLLSQGPKLLPQAVCIVGARSFEPEEQHLLEKLGVRIFYIEEVEQRGLDKILKEAHSIVNDNSDFYGISLDLDVVDPHEAPGVGTPEKNGLHQVALLDGLHYFSQDPKLIGAEIVEFNPERDENHSTEILVAKLLKQFLSKKGNTL